MIYRVLYTKEAKEDIKDIYEYIAYALSEPTIATNQIKRITNMINSLEEINYKKNSNVQNVKASIVLR